MSSSTESELESRLRSLTESLIQKQTVLEALSTEKNSLVLQLERMEVSLTYRVQTRTLIFCIWREWRSDILLWFSFIV